LKSVLILPLKVSSEDNLLVALLVNVLIEPEAISSDVKLSAVLAVNVFNELVEDSKLVNLLFCVEFVESLELV
jgi:hypothetical protein